MRGPRGRFHAAMAAYRRSALIYPEFPGMRGREGGAGWPAPVVAGHLPSAIKQPEPSWAGTEAIAEHAMTPARLAVDFPTE